MKKLLALLGLSPEASEETAVEKVQTLIDGSAQVAELENRATTAEGELKTLKVATRKADADAFCDTNEALIENREAVHAQYLKDSEGTIALFGSIKAAPKADDQHITLHNRAKKQPGKDEPGTATKTNADVLEGKVQEFKSSNRCSYQQAFDTVTRTNPELLDAETPAD